MEQRYATNPAQIPGMTTDDLRDTFLVPELFAPGEIRVTYTHHDRIVLGGAVPAGRRAGPHRLPRDPQRLLPRAPRGRHHQRRRHRHGHRRRRGLHARQGRLPLPRPRHPGCRLRRRRRPKRARSSTSSPRPRTPTYPSALVSPGEGTVRELGDQLTSNRRTLNQYIHENGVRSCQIVMGVTELHPGSMWNTMPAHTHDRRTECYLYFDVPEDARVIHLLGERDRDPSPRRRRPPGDHLAQLVAALRRRHGRVLVRLGDGRREPGLRRHGRGTRHRPTVTRACRATHRAARRRRDDGDRRPDHRRAPRRRGGRSAWTPAGPSPTWPRTWPPWGTARGGSAASATTPSDAASPGSSRRRASMSRPSCSTPSTRTGVYFKDPGHGVRYYRAGSAASHLVARRRRRAGARRDRHPARLGHHGGDLGRPRPRSSIARSIALTTAGVRVSFDVNDRRALWDAATAAARAGGLAARADIVFVGRDEAETLWGTATPRTTCARCCPTCPSWSSRTATSERPSSPATASSSSPSLRVEVRGRGGRRRRLRGRLPRGARSTAHPLDERLRAGHRRAALTLRTTGDSIDERIEHMTDDMTAWFDEAFSGAPLMAILRGMGVERSVALATTAWDLGIDSVEVPLQTPEDERRAARGRPAGDGARQGRRGRHDRLGRPDRRRASAPARATSSRPGSTRWSCGRRRMPASRCSPASRRRARCSSRVPRSRLAEGVPRAVARRRLVPAHPRTVPRGAVRCDGRARCEQRRRLPRRGSEGRRGGVCARGCVAAGAARRAAEAPEVLGDVPVTGIAGRRATRS